MLQRIRRHTESLFFSVSENSRYKSLSENNSHYSV